MADGQSNLQHQQKVPPLSLRRVSSVRISSESCDVVSNFKQSTKKSPRKARNSISESVRTATPALTEDANIDHSIDEWVLTNERPRMTVRPQVKDIKVIFLVS